MFYKLLWEIPIFLVVVVVFLGAFFVPVVEVGDAATLLTVATFLFGILAGFFISRQGDRYSEVRNIVSDFDGNLSTIYRFSGHLGHKEQKEVGQIIQREYKKIMAGCWDAPVASKSRLLTDIHQVIEKFCERKSITDIQHESFDSMFDALSSLQTLRKQMLSLRQERIPFSQWMLIYLLAIILLVLLATIPSIGLFLASALKAVFAAIVILIILVLHQFDRLSFFEGTIGQASAQDLLDIIAGKK